MIAGGDYCAKAIIHLKPGILFSNCAHALRRQAS